MNLERRSQIADLIKQQKTIKNAELMERFGISIETVRRDLDYLEKQGVLRKVYGGAVVSELLNSEPEYANRAELHHLQKDAIAREAVKLIQPGDAVYMGVGTTVQAMVQYMRNIGPITVFTNVLRTAVELSEISDCTVILTGGRLRAKELTLSEFPAEENLSHFNLDKAFIGIGGINPQGITDFHVGEARLHRRILENAKQSIALADSSKIGLRAMNNVCTLKEMDLVITDGNAPLQAVSELENAGAKVIIAK